MESFSSKLPLAITIVKVFSVRQKWGQIRAIGGVNKGRSGGVVYNLLDDLMKLFIHVRVCRIGRGKIAENRKKCKNRDF